VKITEKGYDKMADLFITLKGAYMAKSDKDNPNSVDKNKKKM